MAARYSTAEHPFYCTGVYDEASWVLKESIIPTMRYMIANPAATREQVKDEIKAVYHTDSYLPTTLLKDCTVQRRTTTSCKRAAGTAHCPFCPVNCLMQRLPRSAGC